MVTFGYELEEEFNAVTQFINDKYGIIIKSKEQLVNFTQKALTFMMNHDFIQALNSLKKSLSLCKEYEMRIVILKQICFVLNKLKAYPELCEYQDMLLHAYEGY